MSLAERKAQSPIIKRVIRGSLIPLFAPLLEACVGTPNPNAVRHVVNNTPTVATLVSNAASTETPVPVAIPTSTADIPTPTPTKDDYIKAANYITSVVYDQQDVKKLSPEKVVKLSMWHISAEIDLYRKLNRSYPPIASEIIDNKVAIDSTNFDLTDPTQRILADARMQVELDEILSQEDYPARFRYANETIARITKLAQMPSFRVVDNVAPYMPAEHLATIQPVLQLLDQRHKSLPHRWNFDPSNPGYDSNSQVLTLGESDPIAEIVRYYLQTDPSLSNESPNTDNFTDPKDFALLNLDFRYNWLRKMTRSERLVQAMTAYIQNGQKFRERIQYARLSNHRSAAEFLNDEYNIGNRWLGVGTMENGIPMTPIDIKKGGIYTVFAYDGNDGIVAKDEATSDMDPKRWVFTTYNGDAVEVINPNPTTVIYDGTDYGFGLVRDMVLVQIVSIDNTGESNPISKTAWMPESYLNRYTPR